MTRAPYPDRLNEPEAGVAGSVPIAVDLVHVVTDRPRLVFDAKYKVASANDRYPNADHYQMLAYCTALQVPRAWLVYAQGGRPVERHIKNTGVSVVEYPLDLRACPAELLRQVEQLAADAWAPCEPQLRAMS